MYRPPVDILISRRAAPIVALVAGALAACGFQPLALWPLTIGAVAGLIVLVAAARTWRGAAAIGWLFGVAHFSVGDNWIVTAFTYQANMPAWLGWIAVVLLSLYLAVYPMLATAAAWSIAERFGGRAGGARRYAGLALGPCWIVTEWLRATVFTGFAWNPLGVALLGGFDTPGLAALTPWIGTYGLSGLLVGIAALALIAARRIAALDRPRTVPIVASVAGIGLLVAGMTVPATGHKGASGRIPFTLVQPDARQEVLDDPEFFEPMFQRTARLSRALRAGPRLVLWPESGVPDYLRDGYPQHYYDGATFAGDPRLARARIARVIGPGGLLLTGTVDLVLRGDRAVGAYNTVTALDSRGAIVGSYAKAHLVPFGEYLALRWLLEPLGATRLVPGSVDFLAGPGPRTLDLGGLGRAGVQTCYEITFSGQVVDAAHRPDFLFNPSNDGWFGAWGPPQHLAQARLRAIEEGLPVLRSTTTGISAVISPDGVVRARLPQHVLGRIDGLVPRALPATPFARLGNALPLGIAVLWLAISVVVMRRRRR